MILESGVGVENSTNLVETRENELFAILVCFENELSNIFDSCQSQSNLELTNCLFSS